MRRKIALLLCMTLLMAIGFTPIAENQVYAAERAAEVIRAIGVMNTDKGNTTNSTDVVTRARFAQMLVNMSTLKNDVTAESNVSLFSDVKKTYWAAGYIQTAVTKGWMSGYLNGTFKPAQGITLYEAVSAVLKLLGYSSSDFTGNKVSAIMKLYQTKELNTNITKSTMEKMTDSDCMYLFYNTLSARTKEGTVYATSLGYTIDSNGELDYVSLVNTGVEGPVIVDDNWTSELPFEVSVATMYKNGVECKYADICDYDVVYYSEAFKTLWFYDDKVTGTVDSIDPNYTSPTSVEVGSNSYGFADSNVTLRFSAMGDVKEGDVVTLLLGKDGTVVDVLSMDEYNVTINGIIIEKGTTLAEDADGYYSNSGYVVYVDAGGTEHTQLYNTNDLALDVGEIVSVTYTDGVAKVSKFSQPVEYFGDYTFRSDGSGFGNTTLASNAKILDYQNGQYSSIYPIRMKNVKVNSGDVLYYQLNDNGEISELILHDATGDLDSYGIMIGLTYSESKMVYNYMIGNKTVNLTTTNISNLNIEEGPTGFSFNDGSLESSYALTGVAVTAITSSSIQYNAGSYLLADDCSVYLYLDGEYVSTTIDKISSLSKFNLKAYYDKSVSAGGRIRVIVAYIK